MGPERPLAELSFGDLTLLRDGLRAGVLGRAGWTELAGWWLLGDTGASWLLELLEAQDGAAAAGALESGCPGLSASLVHDVASWSVLGFLWLRHERGLSLLHTLELAQRCCEQAGLDSLASRVEGLRSEHEYLAFCVEDGSLGPDALAALEAEVGSFFLAHRRGVVPWWERPSPG